MSNSNGTPDSIMLDVAVLHQQATRLLRERGEEQWDKTREVVVGNIQVTGTHSRLTVHLLDEKERVYHWTCYRNHADVKFDAEFVPKVLDLLDRVFVLDRLADV